MLKVESNLQKRQMDKNTLCSIVGVCRICRKGEEPQHHILEKCENVHQNNTTNIIKEDLKEEIQYLKEVPTKIEIKTKA